MPDKVNLSILKAKVTANTVVVTEALGPDDDPSAVHLSAAKMEELEVT